MTLREEVEQAVKELMFSYAYRGALYLEGSKPDILPVPISKDVLVERVTAAVMAAVEKHRDKEVSRLMKEIDTLRARLAEAKRGGKRYGAG